MQSLFIPSLGSALLASGAALGCRSGASPAPTSGRSTTPRAAGSPTSVPLPAPASGPDSGRNLDPRATDAQLVGALLARREGAWRSFLARYDHLICHSIRRATCRGPMLLVTDEERADIRASFLLSLFAHDGRTLRRFDVTRGPLLSTWLAALAANHAVDHVRALCAHRHVKDGPPRIPSPEERLVEKEGISRVREALSSLKPRQRELFELYSDAAMPAAEVASHVRASLQTAPAGRHEVDAPLARAVQDEAGARDDAA